MTRVSMFSSPFLLGFEAFEERLDRLAKTADGYPPYNIERHMGAEAEVFTISVAVAGFVREELDVSVEDNQLHVRGHTEAQSEREFLHRGIANRQFQRTFLLAQGMEVDRAELEDGLLRVTIVRPEPANVSHQIEIKTSRKGVQS